MARKTTKKAAKKTTKAPQKAAAVETKPRARGKKTAPLRDAEDVAPPPTGQHFPEAIAVAALKSAIKDISEMMGVAPALLGCRSAGDGPREVAVLSVRRLALGAVASLGRSLGLGWSSLYGQGGPECLVGVQRTTLPVHAAQWEAWIGRHVDGPETPAGGLATFARDRFVQIERAAFRAAAAGQAK